MERAPRGVRVNGVSAGLVGGSDGVRMMADDLLERYRQVTPAGRLVKLAEERNVRLDRLTLEDLRSVDPEFTAEALETLDLDRALAARASFGGTAPDNVRTACRQARQRFLKPEE